MLLANRRLSTVLVARRVAPRESQPRGVAARRRGPADHTRSLRRSTRL